jgi:hypothetical protein
MQLLGRRRVRRWPDVRGGRGRGRVAGASWLPGGQGRILRRGWAGAGDGRAGCTASVWGRARAFAAANTAGTARSVSGVRSVRSIRCRGRRGFKRRSAGRRLRSGRARRHGGTGLHRGHCSGIHAPRRRKRTGRADQRERCTQRTPRAARSGRHRGHARVRRLRRPHLRSRGPVHDRSLHGAIRSNSSMPGSASAVQARK